MHELQSCAGLLNFLNKAIHPGRAFTQHMYAKFSQVVGMSETGEGQLDAMSTKKLKPHHHISLDSEFRSDCEMWQEFLEQGKLSVCRPFVDLEDVIQADELFFFTDSSANPNLGMGAVFNHKWLFGQWEEGFVEHE